MLNTVFHFKRPAALQVFWEMNWTDWLGVNIGGKFWRRAGDFKTARDYRETEDGQEDEVKPIGLNRDRKQDYTSASPRLSGDSEVPSVSHQTIWLPAWAFLTVFSLKKWRVNGEGLNLKLQLILKMFEFVKRWFIILVYTKWSFREIGGSGTILILMKRTAMIGCIRSLHIMYTFCGSNIWCVHLRQIVSFVILKTMESSIVEVNIWDRSTQIIWS